MGHPRQLLLPSLDAAKLTNAAVSAVISVRAFRENQGNSGLLYRTLLLGYKTWAMLSSVPSSLTTVVRHGGA